MVQSSPAGNQFLLGAWEAMSDVAHALVTVTDRHHAVLPQLAGVHQAILDGLRAGAEAVTRTALPQHYETRERTLARTVPAAVSRTVANVDPLLLRQKPLGARTAI